jgi:hypothetical protein
MLGVTDRAVAYFRHKHKIANRPSPLEALSDEQLRGMYDEHSDGDLADRLGVSKPAIRQRRHQAGIPAISKTERVRRRKEAQALKLKLEPVVLPKLEPKLPELVAELPEPKHKIPYRQTENYRQREAVKARIRRVEHRKLHPAKTRRTFTCGVCGKQWDTDEPGNFHP